MRDCSLVLPFLTLGENLEKLCAWQVQFSVLSVIHKHNRLQIVMLNGVYHITNAAFHVIRWNNQLTTCLFHASSVQSGKSASVVPHLAESGLESLNPILMIPLTTGGREQMKLWMV